MKIPKQARHEAKMLFHACQVEGRLDEARVRQYVQRITAEKPRSYIAILSHFQRLVQLEVERRTVRVESFSPLNPDQQVALQARLQGHYGPSLQFTFQQNPALIGGLRIQVGSDVFDGSISGKLNELKECF